MGIKFFIQYLAQHVFPLWNVGPHFQELCGSLPFFDVGFCLSWIFLLQDTQSFKDVVTMAISESFDQSCGKWLPIWIWVLLAPNVEPTHHNTLHAHECILQLMKRRNFLYLKEFFSPSNPNNWVCPPMNAGNSTFLAQICASSISNTGFPSKIQQVGPIC